MIDSFLRKFLYVPAAFAASVEGFSIAEQAAQHAESIVVGWGNLLLSFMLGLVAYFIKRTVDKVDSIGNKVDVSLGALKDRMTVLEAKHEFCLYREYSREGGRRTSDPPRSNGDKED